MTNVTPSHKISVRSCPALSGVIRCYEEQRIPASGIGLSVWASLATPNQNTAVIRSSTSGLLSCLAFPDILWHVSTRQPYVSISRPEVVNLPPPSCPCYQSPFPPHSNR